MKLTKIFCALSLATATAAVAAVRYSEHDKPFLPKSVPTAEASAKLSVMLGKNMPLVAAKVNGRECTLLFDTGATHTTFDAGFLRRELPDTKLEEVALGGISNVEAAPKLCHIDSLEVGEAKFLDFHAMVLDLSDMARGIGADIAGIVGMNVIGSAPALVSLSSGKVVFAPGAKELAGFGKGIARYPDEPMSVAMTPAYSGKMFAIIVDSAASMTFLDKSLGWPSTGEKVDIGAVHVNGESGMLTEKGRPGKLALGMDVELEPMLIDQRASCIGADALLAYDMFVDADVVRFRKASANQKAGDCLDELMPRPRAVYRDGDPLPALALEEPASYCLTVRGGRPFVTQADAEGARYARATFDQLRRLAAPGPVPDCTIMDWPQFRYRGLMLDCGRNYQSVASIKDVIAMLAAYKYNVFHWHLTDNYGWRLESKKHPELQKREAFSRQIGKFYTQAEFKEIVAFAKKRGVTVIPELDMPGHTLAFRKATGLDDIASEKAKIVLGELIDELCTLATADDMPIIHLGTDEARERGEKVPQSHLDYWAGKVTGNGRILMGWSPGLKMPGQSIKQLWMGARDPRGDATPYIDSQNSYYINHVDPEELLSVAAYQQPCRWGEKSEMLGAVIGVWHDDCIADTGDVARMNAVYPAIVLLSDNFWRGREKDEPSLYARLPPPDDPRFALAADLERRTIAQRDKVLKDFPLPFPYVAQTHMRWKMTDANGSVLAENIPQATIYPRHFWFPASAYAPGNNGNVVLETTITSERDVDCGAWIGMTGFSRSDGRSRDAPTPRLGQWNKHGATIELNGVAIAPPKWTHPGVGGNPKEIPLVDEDYWYREPTKIHLRKGENHVRLTLPKNGGWKWIGTFTPILGTSDHPREVPGLKYR